MKAIGAIIGGVMTLAIAFALAGIVNHWFEPMTITNSAAAGFMALEPGPITTFNGPSDSGTFTMPDGTVMQAVDGRAFPTGLRLSAGIDNGATKLTVSGAGDITITNAYPDSAELCIERPNGVTCKALKYWRKQ